MDETPHRITQGSHFPTPEELATWLGATPLAFWERLERYIDETYPGIFIPEGIYGGQKHGWSWRYKKGRSFCTLIPEKGRCLFLVVFGAAERARTEEFLQKLSEDTRRAYEDAPTYHDGKWICFPLDSEDALRDAQLLLAVKRRPPKAPR